MRFIFLFFASFVFCSLTAYATQPLKVVTTFTVLADMVKNIGGHAIEVASITKPGAEIHNYQPTPKDILKVQDADLILYNGFNLERWFERFLVDVRHVPAVTLTKNIEPISIYKGPYSGKPNPHAWMSVKNARIYIDNIQEALSALDPSNKDLYKNNAESYKRKIQALEQKWMLSLEQIEPKKRWLVTSEGAFSYLAKDMAMKELFLWPINADQQGTPQQMNAVIQQIRQNNLPVIFSESTISDKPARQIAAETGIHYGGILYVDSLSLPDGPVPTYLDLLSVTTQTIIQGFKDAREQDK